MEEGSVEEESGPERNDFEPVARDLLRGVAELVLYSIAAGCCRQKSTLSR